MSAGERAAEVMRLARHYHGLILAPFGDISAAYQALDTAVTALAERAYPAPGDWEPRQDDPDDTWITTVAGGYRVYAVQAMHEVEILGAVFTPAEARVLAARLVEAADRLDEHTAAAAIADQQAAAVTR